MSLFSILENSSFQVKAMKLKTTVKIATALLASAIVMTPSTALANRFTNQVRAQLVRAAYALGLGGGYKLTHEPSVSTLRDNGYRYITLRLYRGVSYQIVGVCDEDCRDIDLLLYDGNGNLIDSDTSSGDVPSVSVRPRWTGSFRIRVNMHRCYASSCYYGVGVFGR